MVVQGGRRGSPEQTARPTLALFGVPGLTYPQETKAWPSCVSLSWRCVMGQPPRRSLRSLGVPTELLREATSGSRTLDTSGPGDRRLLAPQQHLLVFKISGSTHGTRCSPRLPSARAPHSRLLRSCPPSPDILCVALASVCRV